MRQILRFFLGATFFSFFFFFQSNAQEINCLDCHENLIANTVHDKVIKCGDCHSDIVSEDHAGAKVKKVNCKGCHAAKDIKMQSDLHLNLMNVPESKAPNCKSCHGTHKILWTSKVPNKEKVYCGKCHKTNVLLSSYHSTNKLSENCIKCHTKKDYQAELGKSIHKNLTCSNCHSYVVNNIADHKAAPKNGVLADCYLCHTAIAAEHKESIHGLSLTEGINEAAQCWNCHGSHTIDSVSDKNSKVYPTNLVATCGKCHDDPAFIKKYSLSNSQPGINYASSVHGILVKAGSKNSATCVTCHGKHDIKNRVQFGSKIAGVNIPNTCEQCHKEITAEFKQSIHWLAVKKGIRGAPSCNDCHSEHNIHAINTINKREEIKKIQDNTCLQCHQSLILSERYGMENGNVLNYQDSYHGLASSRGDKKAAMCVDCHGVHKILPKSHIESTINKNNIVNTCKKCHPKATDVFANSYSHKTQESSAFHIENIVRTIYFWLIVIVVGGMLFHNLLILFHELRARYIRSKNEIRIPRFTKNELIQHTFLLVSFIVLAITGFLLKYPESVLAKGLHYLGFTEGIRQWIHRISAVIMIALSLYHVVYLIMTSRGREVLRGLFPNFNDIRQAINTMLYYMHLTKKHPEYDNYNYMEKVEYWALIWGTLVMGATGLVLWFPTIVGNWAPVWFIKVSEIVHFYEAILATLAILIWHWFFVIFHPKEYPLSFTAINGQMSIAHYKAEHRLKIEKIIIEWHEIKEGKKDRKKMSNFLKLFIGAIEKHGMSMDDFINSDLSKFDNASSANNQH